MSTPSKKLGIRFRDARKARGWSQQLVAVKAGVGGTKASGRIKAIQRLEAGEVMSADVVAKVAQVLELEGVQAPAPDGVVTKVLRRKPKRLLVVDGQACMEALVSLGRDGWRFVHVDLRKDIGDNDVIDDAMLSIARVVDTFRKRGRAPQDLPPQERTLVAGHAPLLSVAKRYAYGRDIRKAAAALRAHGLDLWLVDEWIDYEEVSQAFFTRVFRVEPAKAS